MNKKRGAPRDKSPAATSPKAKPDDLPATPPRVLTGRAIPLLVLAGLSVAFFGDLFFAGRTLGMRDMFCDFLPWRIFTARAFAAGHLPLWDPYAGYGQPFAAEPLTSVFYPLNLIFSILPATWALKVCWTLHLWIAAASMYALARHWKLQTVPALLAGIAYAFGTFLMGNLEYIANLTAAVWGPLVLLLVCRLVDLCSPPSPDEPQPGNPRRLFREVALLALVLAVQYLAGYPEFSMQAVLMSGVYIVTRSMFLRSWPTLVKSTAWFAVAGILAIGLALPQFLATWELMVRYSARASGVDLHLALASAHPQQLLTLFLPLLFGEGGYHGHYWAKTIYEFWLGTFYVGILPLLTAGFAIFYFLPGNRRAARPRFFLGLFAAVLIILGLMMASGRYFPLSQFVHDHVPMFNRFRYPSKYLNWLTYGLALLGGLGYQALGEFGERLRGSRIRIGMISAGAILLALLVCGYAAVRGNSALLPRLGGDAFIPSAANIGTVSQDFRFAILFTVLSAAVVLMGVYRSSHRRWVDVAAVGVLFVNLVCITRQVQKTLPDSVYQWGSEFPLAGKIDRKAGRVLTIYSPTQQILYNCTDEQIFKWAQTAGAGNSWLPYEVYQTWQGGIRLERYLNFQWRMYAAEPAEIERLGNIGSVRYWVRGRPAEDILWKGADRTIYVDEKPGALPHAYLLIHWSETPDTPGIVDRLAAPSFDPWHEALVESVTVDAVAGVKTNAVVPQPESSDALLAQGVPTLKDNQNSLEISGVTATRKSLLILTDAWYPGWRAIVDGRDQPIYRVNYMFRGVFLEPGTHSVVFSYEPWQFRYGPWVSALALLLIIGLLVGPMLQARPSSAK